MPWRRRRLPTTLPTRTPLFRTSLTEPSDKRSRKSDDEASVDSEVQEAAKGLVGGESEDLLREAPEEVRAPEDTNPPK